MKTWIHALQTIIFRQGADLGDNCIQNFHLGRYSVAVKLNFRQYIPRFTSPNENFEYNYPHSNAVLQKAAYQPTKCDVIDDIKLFPTVYRRIYCHNVLMLSNQMSCYKIKYVRVISAIRILYQEKIILQHRKF